MVCMPSSSNRNRCLRVSVKYLPTWGEKQMNKGIKKQHTITWVWDEGMCRVLMHKK